MTQLFNCGADKIAINTYVAQFNPELIDYAAHLFGSQSVVVNIEAKQWGDMWECYTDCGRERSGRDVLEWVREAQERGAGEILLQSVDRDGRKIGFDIELLKAVKSEVSIPLVAASGAGSLDDIIAVHKEASPDAVAVASVLHYGDCNIANIKKALEEHMDGDT